MKALAPGNYGTVQVLSGARLKLSSGVYYLKDLSLQSASTLELQQDSGPVTVYVQQTLVLRGSVRTTSGAVPDWLVAVLGSGDVVLEAPIIGTVIAPNARLTLRGGGGPTTFSGYFAAKRIEVSPDVTVNYLAPNTLLVASGVPLSDCGQAVKPRNDLTGAARELQYQRDLARYCAMPGASPCEIEIASRVNVDNATAAFSLIGGLASPAKFLALVRDRIRKERAAEDNATLAAKICSSPDTDGDLVPDSLDACPNTTPLVATTDNGCEETSLPPAPSAEDVGRILASGGVLMDPRCSGAAPLPEATPGGFYYPTARERGTFILAGRVNNQPPGCPIWYLFDIAQDSASGRINYQVAFAQGEEVAGLVGMSTPVPGAFIQFNPRPSEPGSRGLLGDVGGKGHVEYRVQTINGGGMRSGWSQWKTTTKADCIALGFTCRD